MAGKKKWYKVTLELRTHPSVGGTHFVTFRLDSKAAAEAIVKATASGDCSLGCQWVSSWYEPEDSHRWQQPALCVTKHRPAANLTTS